MTPAGVISSGRFAGSDRSADSHDAGARLELSCKATPGQEGCQEMTAFALEATPPTDFHKACVRLSASKLARQPDFANGGPTIRA